MTCLHVCPQTQSSLPALRLYESSACSVNPASAPNFKPFESLFWSLKGLDNHPAICSNVFPKPSRVTKRLMDNIRKLRRNSVFLDELTCFFGCELAVVEALNDFGLSLHLPPIDEDFLCLVSSNRLKHFDEGPFCLNQRELSAGIYAEKSRFKMHLLLDAHYVNSQIEITDDHCSLFYLRHTNREYSTQMNISVCTCPSLRDFRKFCLLWTCKARDSKSLVPNAQNKMVL